MSFYERCLRTAGGDLDVRVRSILEAVRRGVEQGRGADANDANVRHMEEFLAFLEERFSADRLLTEVQRLPKRWIRTTDRNFIVTVPGRSPERLVLVAHYDTWAGFSREAPGADDNTTGEEVLKHYLLRDLTSEEPPALTHVYLFAGSEECGTRGLVSQLALTLGLSLASLAFSLSSPLFLWLALPLLPLVSYRFGVTGTRYFVERLSEEVRSSIRAAIAVDSVGEGRLYILENEMGANFLRALFPFEGSEKLNDLLEEGAHVHDIKYNRFLGGGTTDSVAFLEGRGGFLGIKAAKPIPAAALVTMSVGKCSPFVFGGKLHTTKDRSDRVYPQPLREVLTVLDYALNVLQGGNRPRRPRRLDEHHYARLYRDGEELLLALKDAVEPNRRNVNSILRVEGTLNGREARVQVREALAWGVETKLDKEVRDFRAGVKEVALDTLVVEEEGVVVRFDRCGGWHRRLAAWASAARGGFERWIGRNSFLAMLAAALLVAFVPTYLLEWGVPRWEWLRGAVLSYYPWVAAGMLVLQLGVLSRLFTRELPTWMDNAYRHRNHADNLRSLRRSRNVPEKRT